MFRRTLRWRAREGQSLVMVALALPLMIGMAGVGVTVGTVYYSQAKLQSAVDAAALAGAKALTDGQSPGNQQSLITINDPSAIDMSVAVSPTNSQEVVASATDVAPGTFAALFGHSTFVINAHATALASPGLPFHYAVFQGDPNPSDPALLLNGNPTILSANGTPSADVHSNNNLDVSGSVTVEGSCGGDPSVSVGGNSACAGGLVQPAPQIPMPQWTPAQVTPPDAITVGSASNPIGMDVPTDTSVAGNYIVYGNLVINGNANVTGHYLVEDGSIIINGNANVSGSLVAFGGGIFMSGNVTQSDGGTLAMAAFTANGQVASDATSPTTDNPPTPGSIVLDGNVTVNSVLYAPDSYVNLYGNVTVNGAAVGYTVALDGNVNVVQPTTVAQSVPVQQVSLVQ